MAKVTWTEDQQKVIDLRNRNILVSAAAGSGKTAVLVERIITMITEGDNPVDIDKLLIVTFTNAAAAEMKERIGIQIEKQLAIMPDNTHLQKQMTLIHSAQITTIHSFCLNVIRNHFNSINLDPSFRVADEAELKLLKSDVIAEMLEQHYEDPTEDFLSFIESYSTSKSDANVEDLILQLYSFSMSYPWPKEWLEEKRELFSITSLEEMNDSNWMKSLIEYIHAVLLDVQIRNEEALRICLEADGPIHYEEALLNDKKIIEDLLNREDYSSYGEAFSNIKFARLSSKKMPEVSDQKKEAVKAIRDDIKKTLGDLTKNYFFQSEEEMLHDIMGVRKVMNVLIDLTIEFLELFAKEKEDNNMVDFNDLEHFALNILVEKKEGVICPTQVAVQLSEHYEELLIDEYQDSNLVQETILTSISKEKFGEPNLFMVGDVKQSIYKFRLARPEIFMEKFESYSLEDSKYQRIDLHKNFRSRQVVLDSVNFICEQIMTKELGNIEYNHEAALYVGATFEEGERVSSSTELLIIPEEIEEEDVDLPKENQSKDNLSKKSLSQDEMEEEAFTAKELEARAIAHRIRELTNEETGMMVWDKEEKRYRLAQFKDIVILLRTMSNWADIFVDTLMAEGIPAYSDTQSGYFSAIEIKTILNALKVIDNPRQDIPLAAVLHSPMVGLTTRDLAIIRAGKKDADLYEALLDYNLHGEDPLVKDKVFDFLRKLEEFRAMVSYTSVHELILNILERTGYYNYVLAMPAGDRRSANIDMLVQRATVFEQSSYRGLFNFVRYIEKLHKYDIDFGEAGTNGENDNTVRIMSIHKSKGLEFPIVFASGLGKTFNNQDARSKLVIHPDLGLGPDYIDYELRMKSPTLIKKVMQKKLVLENLGEELRVLYVALTRAKEKLILTGTMKKPEEQIRKYSSILSQQEKKHLFHNLSSASNYMDWIIPALVRHRSFEEILKNYGIHVNREHPYYHDSSSFEIKIIYPIDLTNAELAKQIAKEVHQEELLNWDVGVVYDQTARDEIEKRLCYEYPYQNEIDIKAKVTVTELKKLGQMVDEDYSEKLFDPEDNKERFIQRKDSDIESNKESNNIKNNILVKENDTDTINSKDKNKEGLDIHEGNNVLLLEEDEIIPSFISKEPVVTAMSRGTLYHKVLESIDLSKINSVASVHQELERLISEDKIQKENLSNINPYQIFRFANSHLAKRMEKAKSVGKLFKERQFVLGVGANEVNSNIKSEEIVLIQGIIDVYFEEADGIVLMDYKTDHIEKGQENILIERYRVQLDYYQRAIEQITNKKVKEKIIYSFALNKEIGIIMK